MLRVRRLFSRPFVISYCYSISEGGSYGRDLSASGGDEVPVTDSRRPHPSPLSESKSINQLSTNLYRFFIDKIRVTGPITVAEYMKTVIGSSSVGYYGRHSEQHKIFGSSGDFITSPEISQLFGEMVGVWCYYELANTGHKGPWQLIECGPGTGQLAADLLRVMRNFAEKDVSLHLVEQSDSLIDAQEKLLCGDTTSDHRKESKEVKDVSKSPPLRSNRTSDGIRVSWYHNIDDVPDGFSVVVANEFLDALPIHQFIRKEKGKVESEWLEVYVGLDDRGQLRFVRSQGENLHTKGLLPENVRADASKNCYEISPEAGTFVNQISNRITYNGGFGLLLDYGNDDCRRDLSLRAYSKHQQVDPLTTPGEVDVTADVNFGYLKSLIEEESLVYGPVNQRDFLAEMGIELRLRGLLQECREKESAENLIKAYNMIQGDMGTRFKAIALFPKTLENILRERKTPAGFATASLGK